MSTLFPGREAEHSSPSSAEVKNVWIYTSTPRQAFMERFSVKKAQAQLNTLDHVSRMEDIRYPNLLLDYRSIGRGTGRPLKSPLDG
jgi:hypothetical protein